MRAASVIRLAAVLVALGFQAATVLAPGPAVRAETVERDYPIPGGWFYSQEAREPSPFPPFRGYTVVDDQEASFWTEFRRFGGVDVLGYPVSQRYHYPGPDGYLQQAFQRGILQWRPEQGRAVLANVFEQFTEQGKDDLLETAGIPRPRGVEPLSFADDAQRRMTWLTDPQLLARYLWDPVNHAPVEAQEQAWDFLGLPQTFPERPVYLRDRAAGKFGAPLYLPYIVQRFQKGALQLFLDDVPNDPTIVPGDGKKGCIALTAVGRLARRLGAGSIIPSWAVKPLPLEEPEQVHFVAYVPPLQLPGQKMTQFEFIGTGFDPGEPVSVQLVNADTSAGDVQGGVVRPIAFRVDATDSDGSFDRSVRALVATYSVIMRGERSGKVLDTTKVAPLFQDPVIDLRTPTNVVESTSKAPCE